MGQIIYAMVVAPWRPRHVLHTIKQVLRTIERCTMNHKQCRVDHRTRAMRNRTCSIDHGACSVESTGHVLLNAQDMFCWIHKTIEHVLWTIERPLWTMKRVRWSMKETWAMDQNEHGQSTTEIKPWITYQRTCLLTKNHVLRIIDHLLCMH